MPFVEPATIKDAIESIHKKTYLLPAIQREFVWRPEQIERLFDSIMRDYPISTFLFWEVNSQNKNNYQFYEFVRDYHERDNRHNAKANTNGESDIIAILDGQQRLTSLYIALKGTYAYKLPRKRWDNKDAFPPRKLCLNMSSPSKEMDLEYEFKFLTESERCENKDGKVWYVVGDVLNFKEPHEVHEYVIENVDTSNKEKHRFASKALYKLHEVINKSKVINFFLEKGESLDKVLNIFIRVNSGGTQLSYSDLLLSIASTRWSEKDAREEITDLVDSLNSIGMGFNFNKDFVLKSCLVISDFKEIAFKADNFNQSNMKKIESRWESISDSISLAVVLMSSLGYNRETLTSNNAVIPIAYYLNKIGNPAKFVDSSSYRTDRKLIFKWLAVALLKRIFSGQQDNVLRSIRDSMADTSKGFPFQQISSQLKKIHKSIAFDADDLENLLYYEYGQPYTYSVLALIYSSLDFSNKFHQDHIFPRKFFTVTRLRKAGIQADDIDIYMENFNSIGNLQLLKGIPNQEKSAKDFRKWLEDEFPDKNDRKEYMNTHFIPDVDLSLKNFPEFIEQREKLLVAAFKKLLK
jgi:uncharacterized protein with ParB-like and HNH nuclease domain